MNVWTILNEDLIAVKHEFLPEGARPSENCMPGGGIGIGNAGIAGHRPRHQ